MEGRLKEILLKGGYQQSLTCAGREPSSYSGVAVRLSVEVELVTFYSEVGNYASTQMKGSERGWNLFLAPMGNPGQLSADVVLCWSTQWVSG
jgi:hypothetical protein